MSSRESTRLRVIGARQLDAELPQLSAELRFDIRVVSQILPFRTNRYVVDELIDWGRVPDDPIYRLAFPHRDMLEPEDFARVAALVRAGAAPTEMAPVVRELWGRLNPHPAGQTDLNVPVLDGRVLHGLQHKYRETVLFFPREGQTCHSYCSYCFRWPQFVGHGEMKLECRDVSTLIRYLARHPEVKSVLFTGGDPLVMRATVLARYVDAILAADLPNLGSIRIGSKALSTWPQRFVTDGDADELLRLFERVVASNRSLAFMAHYSHPRELETPIALKALSRVQQTGAVVRSQAPVVRHVNDSSDVWSEMWRQQVRHGVVPYYLFVERDTGAQRYFALPLADAQRIYQRAVSTVSGLARTARGPSMSATPGKVCIDGSPTVRDERVFALRFLQARDPAWVDRTFFARYDADATWFDQLRPAFGAREFFFEAGLREIVDQRRRELMLAA